MIASTNTIVNPRTMVIVSLHTVVADSAVLGPARAYHFTIGAHFTGVYFLEQLFKSMFGFQVARIRTGCPEERNKCTESTSNSQISPSSVLMHGDNKK